MESKKNEKYDLERRRPLFFGIGMIISISLAITAFEWRSEVEPFVYPVEEEDEIYFVMDETQITKHEIPELPKVPKREIKKIELVQIAEALEEKVTYEEPEFELGDIEELIVENTPPAPIVDEAPFEIVEEMPKYPGGDTELLKFIGQNIKYPNTAKNIGVQGRVTVQFIIEKDGSLTEIEILRGIGAGCDKEAIRVMKLVPNFSPGKQRGQPVRVRLSVPITFKLQ